MLRLLATKLQTRGQWPLEEGFIDASFTGLGNEISFCRFSDRSRGCRQQDAVSSFDQEFRKFVEVRVETEL
jgi:hypothetical protein